MCRKPVIGARIGSTACVIDDGTNGVLVLPHDSRDISCAVIGLLADPDSRSRMGQRGYEKTIKQFTWDKICDGMEELLLELIREKSVPDRWRWNSFPEKAIPRKSPNL